MWHVVGALLTEARAPLEQHEEVLVLAAQLILMQMNFQENNGLEYWLTVGYHLRRRASSRRYADHGDMWGLEGQTLILLFFAGEPQVDQKTLWTSVSSRKRRVAEFRRPVIVEAPGAALTPQLIG